MKDYTNLNDEEPLVVSEAAVAVYGRFQNAFEVVQQIRKGVSLAGFEKIQKNLPFSDAEWADILNISSKSLQRYKADPKHVFKLIHAEKIIEMSEVAMLGAGVFGNAAKFFKWLRIPSIALGSMTPAELIKDSYGKELVCSELHRIDQGIFA